MFDEGIEVGPLTPDDWACAIVLGYTFGKGLTKEAKKRDYGRV